MSVNIFPERHIVQRYNYGNITIDERGELVSGKALIGNQVYIEKTDLRINHLVKFGGFICSADVQRGEVEVEFTQISFVMYDGNRTEISRDHNVKGFLRNGQAHMLVDARLPVVIDKQEERKAKPLEIPDNVVSILGRKKH
ncbi:hypothetical protein LMH73_017525 [Vibrio splendidus]|nr:hypothetical protein [Vibrio splendidus]MCC4880337.1 hypothetical protein [Vibrio splendidus]